MNERLYYSAPELFSWNTIILEKITNENGFFIILEETAFYPEGGGQPADTGFIAEAAVIDVIEMNDEILHKVDRLPETGIVECRVDADRRSDHTQHHTGQHLLSSVCIELYNAETVSFHLGQEYVAIDLNTPSLSEGQIEAIENRTNHYIQSNIPIKTYYLEENQLNTIPLRKIPKVTENIRIVEIQGLDYSACCGTHAASTGELGMLKILKTEKNKQFTRVYFVCGRRALTNYQQAHKTLRDISLHFSTGQDEVLERIQKLEKENKSLQKRAKEISEENAIFTARKLIQETTSSFIQECFSEKSLSEIQVIAKELVKDGSRIVLAGSLQEKKVLLMHSGNMDIHCGQLFKETLPLYEGKGGGGSNQAQASFNSTEELTSFMDHISVTLADHTIH
ncbi:alanyl-tRNA editing protein [Falsibacillus albus]|nr:alanine--tRNA ligase-related protein [Falsibacillus albus]